MKNRNKNKTDDWYLFILCKYHLINYYIYKIILFMSLIFLTYNLLFISKNQSSAPVIRNKIIFTAGENKV